MTPSEIRAAAQRWAEYRQLCRRYKARALPVPYCAMERYAILLTKCFSWQFERWFTVKEKETHERPL